MNTDDKINRLELRIHRLEQEAAHRLRRLESTLAVLIAWLPTELGQHNVKTLLDLLEAPEDPNNLEGPPRTPEEVVASLRELDTGAPTPADKFALMFGADERREALALMERFAGSLSACLNTFPDLRNEEVHGPLFDDYKAFRNRKP